MRVHVVCGGGTGSKLLEMLHARGISFSAGILADQDSDALVCRKLGGEVVAAPPGTPAAPEVRERVLGQMRSSEALVLTPFAVGPNNLANLEIVREVSPPVPLYLVSGGDFSRRDYTGGVAGGIYRDLVARSQGQFPSAARLVEALFGPASPKRPTPALHVRSAGP